MARNTLTDARALLSPDTQQLLALPPRPRPGGVRGASRTGLLGKMSPQGKTQCPWARSFLNLTFLLCNWGQWGRLPGPVSSQLVNQQTLGTPHSGQDAVSEDSDRKEPQSWPQSCRPWWEAFPSCGEGSPGLPGFAGRKQVEVAQEQGHLKKLEKARNRLFPRGPERHSPRT